MLTDRPTPPGGPYPYNYLVVSDLHLTLMLDDEDEATDDELIDFLDHYRDHAVDGRIWRLILAGDTFDLLYPDTALFREREPGAGVPKTKLKGVFEHRDVETVAWRLRRTMLEHSRLFAALGEFLLAGHQVVFVKGNHDVELQWARLQATVVDTLHEVVEDAGRQAERETLAARVGFRDWFYVDRGRLYVEHGNQYDEFNCWPNFLDPALVHDPNRAFMAMGSRMTQYLTNAFVEYKPGPAHGTFMQYIKRSGQLFSGKFIGRSLDIIVHALSNAGAFSEEGWRSGGGREDQALRLVEERSGTPAETLHEVAALQAKPATAIRGFFFNRMLLDRLFVVLFSVAMVGLALAVGALSPLEPALLAAVVLTPLAGLYAMVRRLLHKERTQMLQIGVPVVLAAGCLVAPLVSGEGTFRGTVFVLIAVLTISVSFAVLPIAEMLDLGTHLGATAERVRHIMGVDVVVFGHTHRPVHRELEDGGLYLNTGAWVSSGIDSGHAHAVLVHDEEGRLSATLHEGRTWLEAS